MYRIEFYEDRRGKCELMDYLEKLRLQSGTSKTARIEYNQISLYIDLLAKYGTMLSQNITKHLEGPIWELRPGNNRVLYFSVEGNTFVLLHHFRKKSQKTPRKELERAKAERDDYLSRQNREKKGAEGS